jgi:hypothetical protein
MFPGQVTRRVAPTPWWSSIQEMKLTQTNSYFVAITVGRGMQRPTPQSG